MFEMFSPKIVSFILDMDFRTLNNGKSHLANVIPHLIENVVKLNEEDIIYVYVPTGDLCLNETIGEAISVLSGYKEHDFDLSTAIKETIFLLGEYGTMPKSIFVLTNRYKTSQEFRVKKALLHAAENNCHFYFYGIGRHYNKSLLNLTSDRVSYSHFEDQEKFNEQFTNDFAPLIEPR